jgi:hypothetical protein
MSRIGNFVSSDERPGCGIWGFSRGTVDYFW